MRRIATTICAFLLVFLAAGCAGTAGRCPSDMPGGERSLVMDGGAWSAPPLYAGIGAKIFVQKDAGCHLRPFAHTMSATLPPGNLYDPLGTLAEMAAKTHDPPLSRQDIIVLRTGYGKQVRHVGGRLIIIPLFSVEMSPREGTVVIYVPVEDWDGLLPSDQPWVKRKS